MDLPKSLVDALRRRQVVPFVGAGLSRGVRARDGSALFPNWGELLSGAGTALRDEHKYKEATLVGSLVDADDLLEAAKRAETAFGRAHWLRYLKRAFDRTYEEADPGSLGTLRQIWALGSNLIVTTNYDRALQWSCPDRADYRIWDIEAKAEQVAAIRDGDVPRPTVWHLHGHIDNAVEMVITPGGYAGLYGTETATPRYQAALDTLRTILKSHSLLFVGFSLTDADFMRQVVGVNETYSGAAGQHYALLRRSEGDARQLRLAGVEPVFYDDHDEISAYLTAMSMQSLQSLPVHVKAGHYIVDRNEGLYLFGGRGDAFFRLYDEALLGIQDELDIFSLKLGRFRRQHSATLLAAAARTRIRIALLDPSFPLPEDHISLASIREREERSPVGAIRRDVAEWTTVCSEYRRAVDDGAMEETERNGLHIRLYNILPTVNLFRVDTNLFVGPYLLDVEDRETPTFLIKSEAPGHSSMGNTMFKVYQRHFEAVWTNPTTRPLASVREEELQCWREGRGFTPSKT
jgi:SIR2-like domain